MRKRDLVSLAAAGVLAATGVLTLPLGASAAEPPPSVQVDVAEPTAGPSAESEEPEGEPTDEPSTDPTPDPTEEPTEEPSEDPPPTPSPTPAPSETPDKPGKVEVDDAVFTWSMSEQTNARSHNPLAINFLAAGQANPGRGGAHLKKNQWKASEGQLTIQKRTAKGAWRKATWDGLGTDAKGDPIGVYGPFSGHRVRITDGTGTLDPAADDATLSWKGTWTVVYYSGNTVFTLTDPVLEVKKGKGELRALAGGWAADRNDPTQWTPVKRKVVPVVTLSKVDVTKTGLVVTPDYRGVEVTGTLPQKRTGDDWGSFPQELVTFLEPMGTDQFWYSTGLQSDWTKLPTPIRVGWKGAEPETPAPTEPRPPKPEPSNPIVSPPVVTAPTTPSVPLSGIPSGPPATSSFPLASSPLASDPSWDAFLTGTTATQVTAVGPDDVRLVAAPTSPSTPWVVGGAFLLGAALLLLVPLTGRTPR